MQNIYSILLLDSDADLQGCLWHLCRAFVKKARKLRLMRFRRVFPALFDIIRMTCAIALLSKEYFPVGLDIVKNKAMETDILIAYLLRPFFTYVERRWLNNARRKEWMSLFNAPHRTTGFCESHNRMLRKQVGAYRPNVYLFIEALARLEHNASLDIEFMMEGGTVRRSRRCVSIYTDRQLAGLCNDLDMDIFHNLGETVSNFLSQASHLFHDSFNQHVEREGGRL